MKLQQTLLFCAPLLLLSGCHTGEGGGKVSVGPPTENDKIVIGIGEHFDVLHVAQPGQTLEWRANGPKTPRFWILFTGPSPCSNGAFALQGNASTPASCVVGPAKASDASAGGGGGVVYSYLIRSTPPPPGDHIPDRSVPCIGCNN